MPENISFTEENIHLLFGAEAAEDEEPGLLRGYYFKGNAYDQMMADLPLRVLVGHKGIGKSALFKVARAEDSDKSVLSIFIQPNDIADLGTEEDDFLHTIRSWTDGLSRIIIKKAFEEIGSVEPTLQIPAGQIDIVHYLINQFDKLDPVNGKIRWSMVLAFLNHPRFKIYIDDLDRGWQGKHSDILRISALLNAVRDLTNQNPGLIFKIALRSDVYYLVRTSDESTDKIEGSVIWHSWTNQEILILLIKRIENFFGRTIDEKSLLKERQITVSKYLNPVMEERFTGRGHWANAPIHRVLISLIRKRPRDLVKLCTSSARAAYIHDSTKIRTPHLESIFEEYSQGRIQDTINEYRSELPQIERLLMNMKPNRQERQAKKGYVYTTEGLLDKIDRIIEQQRFTFFNNKTASKQDLAAFLYKINFITARKETPEGVVRKYFEENRYLSSQFADFGFDWEVHPAYRWALQPDTIDSIYSSLELNAE